MHNHAPAGYRCPFCLLARGEAEGMNRQDDVFYRDPLVTAFVAPLWWPQNAGHVLIIPNEHFEHIYDLPRRYAHRVQDVAQMVAIGFKEVYGCEGVSTRQHNEPAGNQDVWHYHLHVFPRSTGDDLYRSRRSSEIAPPEQRADYAFRLRSFLAAHPELTAMEDPE